jgi:ABC-type antimicrobial peptide transport system permease subunit
MLHQLLHKIIQTGVGRGRAIMAGVGLSVALLLILSAVQIQVNYNELLYGQTNQDSTANFLVINKQIDGNSATNTLSEQEITDLRQQPFIDAIGQLTASRFKVSAQSPSERFPFYTDLFFESVPDTFIDVQSKDWQWSEGSTMIPLVIPNQFLDLYNFGFAPSQNLVQLTQSMVMSLPVVLHIHQGATVVPFTGRVVGFSDRISSVLVPQTFLTWANNRFGNQQASGTSRVVIQTKDPGNPTLVNYLKSNGLVTDADKTRFSKYRQIVNAIVSASWITGAVMLLFALLVFSLFVQLTIASTQKEIGLLITLGASPKQLQSFLVRHFLPGNIVIAVLCLLVVAILQWLMQRYLAAKSMFIPAVVAWQSVAATVLIVVVLWLVIHQTVKKYIGTTT